MRSLSHSILLLDPSDYPNPRTAQFRDTYNNISRRKKNNYFTQQKWILINQIFARQGLIKCVLEKYYKLQEFICWRIRLCKLHLSIWFYDHMHVLSATGKYSSLRVFSKLDLNYTYCISLFARQTFILTFFLSIYLEFYLN